MNAHELTSRPQGWKRYSFLMILLLLTVFFSLYYYSWHRKPFTQNAFVVANTCLVTPLQPGYIESIAVKNNEFVRKGQLLFTTYREPYQLKLEQAMQQLAAADAALDALRSQIEEARETVRGKKAMLANLRYLADRGAQMYRTQAVSQAYWEEKEQAKTAGEADWAGAVHALEALKSSLRSQLASREALVRSVSLARINFRQTQVFAGSDGYVCNMTMTPGAYGTPGQALFGFVDTSVWWVQANFKENELHAIAPGQRARIWLWQYPGKEFHGVVEDTCWGAERRQSASTGLPVVDKENEWFLLPQRFPVQIRILDPDPERKLHVGASAYVQIDILSRPVRQFFWQLLLW